MTLKIFFKRLGLFLAKQLIPNIGSVLLIGLILLIYNARAEQVGPSVSRNILSYQGTLYTASGLPVTENIGMTFRFYDAYTGGNTLWTESWTGENAVPVSNGLFHVRLGSLVPIPTSVWTKTNVYLGILIAGESAELSPREIVSAVPVSMMTGSYVIPDGSITQNKIADGAVTSSKLSRQYDMLTLPAVFTMPGAWTSTDILTYNITVSKDTLVTIYGNLWCRDDYSSAFCGSAITVDDVDVAQIGISLGQGTSEGLTLAGATILTPGSHTIKLRVHGSRADVTIHQGATLTIVQG